MRRRLSWALAGLVVVVVAACGIPSDDGATLARPGDVPFDLLAPAETPDPTPTTQADTPASATTVFFVQGERLAPVEREVASPGSAEIALEALAAGPTQTEQALGLRTALVGDDVMRTVGISGGSATVDLGLGFAEIVGRDQILALAQIVSTLTGLPGVGRVRFTLEGIGVGVPRGDGSITSESVSRDDYNLMAPVPLG